MGFVFFGGISGAMTNFTKPPLTPEAHLKLLMDRGLVVPDQDKAIAYIKSIGYFRLKSYSRHVMVDPTSHNLVEGTTFDQILSYYVFDRELRLLTLDAIERIEVAIKAKFCGIVATHTNNAHWYLVRKLFKEADRHADFIEKCGQECNRCPDRYIESYQAKYKVPPEPPCWMAFEVLPFGAISKAYENLDTSLQSLIASEFGFNRRVVLNWLHTLTVVRNVCAHHHTLWNRSYPTTPIVPDKWQHVFDQTDINSYAARAVVCALWLSVFIPASEWRYRLEDLLNKFPHITPKEVGFKAPIREIFKELPVPLKRATLLEKISEIEGEPQKANG